MTTPEIPDQNNETAVPADSAKAAQLWGERGWYETPATYAGEDGVTL
ncbi:hypothetical protein [Rhodococcus ruber]